MAGNGIDVMKKGPWSSEEDHKLIAYIRRYGIWNWNHMASPAGLARSGKSCRLRWMNYLRPNLRHGNFTQEEEEIIIKWQQAVGNKWSLISSKLEGRTDNEVKNYWNTRLKKRFVAEEEEEDCAEMNKSDEFEESLMTKRWIKEEYSSTSDDTTSEMLAQIYWDDQLLYAPIMTTSSIVEHDDFESMLMVSSSSSNYALQDSLALDHYCIDDNLWDN